MQRGTGVVARGMADERPEKSAWRCPVCRAKVVVELQGEVVIHNAILKVDSPTGRVTAKCARCKAWMEVPLRYIG